MKLSSKRPPPKPNWPPRLRRANRIRITSWDLGHPKGDGRDGNFLPLPVGYEDDEDGDKKKRKDR